MSWGTSRVPIAPLAPTPTTRMMCYTHVPGRPRGPGLTTNDPPGCWNVTGGRAGTGARMRIVVAGAACAGLMAAYRIVQAGHEVVVLEARGRVGGRVWSQELLPGDPRTVVERGGEFVLDGYDVMRGVLAELGLGLAGTAMSYYQRDYRGGAGGPDHAT